MSASLFALAYAPGRLPAPTPLARPPRPLPTPTRDVAHPACTEARPAALEATLSTIPGVVECGLFVGLVDTLIAVRDGEPATIDGPDGVWWT